MKRRIRKTIFFFRVRAQRRGLFGIARWLTWQEEKFLTK
jgi:hypothetical protein